MLLLLLACARAPLPPAPMAAPPTPPTPEVPALEAPAPEETARAPLQVEILELGLSMHGGDGDHVPLTVTWVANAQLTLSEGPMRVEEVRWVVEAQDLRFIARGAGGEAPLSPGGPPVLLEASRPLSVESFKLLREQTAEVTLLVVAEDASGAELKAQDTRSLVHPLR